MNQQIKKPDFEIEKEFEVLFYKTLCKFYNYLKICRKRENEKYGIIIY